MGTLLQVLLIAGVCAGIGALLHRRNYQAGAGWGLGIGLLIAGLVYWQDQAAVERQRFEESADKGARTLDEIDATHRSYEAERKRNDDDMKNGKYGWQGEQVYLATHKRTQISEGEGPNTDNWQTTAAWCFDEYSMIWNLRDSKNNLAADDARRAYFKKAAAGLLGHDVHWTARIIYIDENGATLQLKADMSGVVFVHIAGTRGLHVTATKAWTALHDLRTGAMLAFRARVAGVAGNEADPDELDIALTDLKPD